MQRKPRSLSGYGVSVPKLPAFAATGIFDPGVVSGDASPVSALSAANGHSADRIDDRVGEVAAIWGYVSATARPRVFLLTEESSGYCQMCGISHTGGPSLTLRCRDDSLSGISDIEPIVVEGTVWLGPAGSGSFFQPRVELLDVTRRMT